MVSERFLEGFWVPFKGSTGFFCPRGSYSFTGHFKGCLNPGFGVLACVCVFLFRAWV